MSGTNDAQDQRPELITLIGLTGKTQLSPDHVGAKIPLGDIIIQWYALVLQERPAHGFSRLQVDTLAFCSPIDSQSRTAFQRLLETLPQPVHSPEVDELVDFAFLPPVSCSNHRMGNQQQPSSDLAAVKAMEESQEVSANLTMAGFDPTDAKQVWVDRRRWQSTLRYHVHFVMRPAMVQGP